MLLKSFELRGRKPVVFAVLAVSLTLALLYRPARAFIADYKHGSIQTILDNKETEVVDTIPLNTKSLPLYLEALEAAKSAASIEPMRPKYHKALSNYYAKLGNRAKIEEFLGMPKPQGMLLSKDYFELAIEELRLAIGVAPVDYEAHLTMGVIFDSMKASPELSEEAYERAAKVFPVNVLVRYAIVRQYLSTDRPGRALEHARALAAADDTYKLPDTIYKKEIMEIRPGHYQTKITKSYLYKALDVAWRVSKDRQVVKGIVPNNDEAKVVLETFFDLNHIEE